jgi:FlaA1/EpsC-like NDP-sugar epimerase
MVTLLQEQMTHCQAIMLPQPDAKQHFLSKHAGAHFVLQSLALARANPTEEGIFICSNGTTISLREIANKLALLNGVQLEPDLPMTALQSSVIEQKEEAIPPSQQTKAQSIIPTTHAHISLVRHAPSTAAPELLEAIHNLFDLQEGDLKNAVWEKPTHTLLTLSGSS